MRKLKHGTCQGTTKGEPCKQGPVSGSIYCISHLRHFGGHLFVLDQNDPEWLREGHERMSYCRACGAIKDEKTLLEPCAIRQNRPESICPTSDWLPTRLQYRFAKAERGAMVVIGGRRMIGAKHGPFFAYRSAECGNGFAWQVLHVPSQMPVAALDSEKESLALMRQMCKDGIELDFKDPMRMDRHARFFLHLSVRHYCREDRCVRIPGGLLTMTAKKAYFRQSWEVDFLRGKTKEKAECWGPFGFGSVAEGIVLWPLEYRYYPAAFLAPSRERAIAFSKAAAALDLDWWEDHYQEGSKYRSHHPETRASVASLLAGFPDVRCLNEGLLPERSIAQPAIPEGQGVLRERRVIRITVELNITREVTAT